MYSAFVLAAPGPIQTYRWKFVHRSTSNGGVQARWPVSKSLL
jgi:hypothetical protein